MNDPAYKDYMEEVENMRHRNKKSDSYDFNKVLSHLGLPEYEYIDAQNYDYLLPTHLTYGNEQTVKIHNTKIMSSEILRHIDVVFVAFRIMYKKKRHLGEIGGLALNKVNDKLVVFHRVSRIWEDKYFTGNYRFRNELYGPIDEDAVLHIDTRTGQIKFRWDAKMFYMLYDLTIDHTVNF
ncbi:unnamed protein product [Rotaria sp. Silwood2]|nr:unnamed protein product [Rotaria sp. Silwood2]